MLINLGYLNSYATSGSEGTNGLNCNCPDDCNQIVYSKVKFNKMVSMVLRIKILNFCLEKMLITNF